MPALIRTPFLQTPSELTRVARRLSTSMTAGWLTIAVCLFLVATANRAFFTHLSGAYPPTTYPLFFGVVVVVQVALLALLLQPFATPRLVRPVLSSLLVLAASVAWFQDQYGLIFDAVILESIAQTDSREALDLVSGGMVLHIVLFGFVPAFWVSSRDITRQPLAGLLKARAITSAVCLLAIVASLLTSSANVASLLREHKEVRYYTNPLAPIVLAIQTLVPSGEKAGALAPMGLDASIGDRPDSRPRLVVLVVGEAVRADHLGINGYERNTTPGLANEHLLNLSNVSSCGTATAVSVPCMFSFLGHDSFTIDDGRAQENVLDVLARADVNVLWLDNNSDSKGVADRLAFEDYKSPELNPACDSECRDEGMLSGMDAYLDEHPGEDTLIVLHQMGNHGPAYYKRYPSAFEQFTPTCQSNELASCSASEIINAYDNALLYTDHFLTGVIADLKRRTGYRTTMMYVADHGESLGEFGMYLHGLPYGLAPESQTHVPWVMWFGAGAGPDASATAGIGAKHWSHDNVPATLLDLFTVRSDTLPLVPSVLASAGGQ